MKRLLALWLLVLFSPVEGYEADHSTVTIVPQQIEMGGTFRSCVQGLGPDTSADVWFLRPNSKHPEIQFDWQQQPCESHTFDTGWNKDVGVWEIVAVRLHPKGVYTDNWRNTSAVVDVKPNKELLPEFEWLAQRRRQATDATVILLVAGVLYITFFGLVPAWIVQRSNFLR